MLIRISAALLLSASLGAPALATGGDDSSVTPTAQQTNPDDRMRCKRIAITGSLVRAEKVCKTVGEWRRLSERGNDQVREYMDTGRVCAGGACGNGG